MNRNLKILIIVMTGLLTTSIIAFFLTSYLMVGCTEDTASSDNQGQGVQPLWIKQIGTPAGTSVYDMVMEKDDKILVTGTVSGRLPLSATYGNNFLMRFTTEGEHIWTRQYDFGMNGKVKKMELDSDGNIYLIGSTYGDIGELKNANQSSSPGSTDVFLTKINKSGDIIWTKMWGTETFEYGDSIIISDNGNISILVSAKNDFIGYTNIGEYDFYIMKLDLDGNEISSKQFGSTENDVADYLYQDQGNYFYISGYTDGIMGDQSQKGDGDIFVIKMDADYNIIWTKMWGTEEWDETTGMAFDNQGNFYLTWNIKTKRGPFYVVKCDPDGNDIWKKALAQSNGNSTVHQLKTENSANSIFLTGSTSGNLTPFVDWSVGISDFFIIRLDQSGNNNWIAQKGSISDFNTGSTAGADGGGRIVFDKNGYVYVAGDTNGYMEPGYDPGYIPSDIFIMKYDPNSIP